MNAYRVLVDNAGRKRPLGRQKHRWENNIKMGLIISLTRRCALDSFGSG
jgi:hypothetical protein